MSRSSVYMSHARATLVLGLPIIGSNLAQFGLTVSDTLMLGRYGVAELAAATVAGSSFFMVFLFGSGFAQAVMPLVAESSGRGDEAQLRRDARMGLWLSVVFGLAAIPLFWVSGRWMLALGQTPRVADLSQDFLRITGFGMVPMLMVMALKSVLAALGRTQVLLAVTLAAVALNVAIGVPLIFGIWGAPEMGIRGAGVAQLAVQWATLAALGLYAQYAPGLRQLNLFGRFWRPDWSALGQVFRLGWPIGVTGLAESGLFTATSIMMGWVGTVALAAHGIAIQGVALAFMLHLGLSNAATIRLGRFAGAGDFVALRQAAGSALALSVATMLGVIVLFLAVPQPILRLFLDAAEPRAPEILVYGTTLLAVAALLHVGDAMQVMALGMLRGIKDTAVPMWAATVSYWVIGIPAGYALGFPLGLGGVGIWLGLTLGLFAAAGSMMVRFWRLAPRAA